LRGQGAWATLRLWRSVHTCCGAWCVSGGGGDLQLESIVMARDWLVFRCRRRQQQTEDVFSEINPTTLNRELTALMPGLSAKVFRTYNASITLERELAALSITASKEEKARPLTGWFDGGRRMHVVNVVS
jgi:hypothetical protein